MYRQMATVDELANIKRDIGAIFGLSVYGLGNKSQMMKLGDIVDIKKGNYAASDVQEKGKIPFYSASKHNPVGYHEKATINTVENIVLLITNGRKIS